MSLDKNITQDIIKLSQAWDKAQEISTKIENKLINTTVNLNNGFICVSEKIPVITDTQIDRNSVLNYLKSTIQAIEHDKLLITNLYEIILNQQQSYINEIGIMAVSQLLNNLINLDKELVKMSKIVSDLLLNWESLDLSKELSINSPEEYETIKNKVGNNVHCFAEVKIENEEN